MATCSQAAWSFCVGLIFRPTGVLSSARQTEAVCTAVSICNSILTPASYYRSCYKSVNLLISRALLYRRAGIVPRATNKTYSCKEENSTQDAINKQGFDLICRTTAPHKY